MCTNFVQNLRKLLGVQVAFPETILILPWDIFWYISIYQIVRHWLPIFFHEFEHNGLEHDIRKLVLPNLLPLESRE